MYPSSLFVSLILLASVAAKVDKGRPCGLEGVDDAKWAYICDGSKVKRVWLTLLLRLSNCRALRHSAESKQWYYNKFIPRPSCQVGKSACSSALATFRTHVNWPPSRLFYAQKLDDPKLLQTAFDHILGCGSQLNDKVNGRYVSCSLSKIWVRTCRTGSDPGPVQVQQNTAPGSSRGVDREPDPDRVDLG
jgi:hypothetical protein